MNRLANILCRCLIFLAIALQTAAAQTTATSSLQFGPAQVDPVEACRSTTAVPCKILKTDTGIRFVRTPEVQFENLPDWPYETKYAVVDGLRMAYSEAGPPEGEVILLLHGQPVWSYLYRKMIPVLARAGYRTIALDHIGMGRSDKPVDLDFYSYDRFIEKVEGFIKTLDLKNITIFVHDWGGLVGLNVVGKNPDRFSRVIAANTSLPQVPAGKIPFDLTKLNLKKASDDFYSEITSFPDNYADSPVPLKFSPAYYGNWLVFSRNDIRFHPSLIVEGVTYFAVPDPVRAAYNSPFPARIHMSGIRAIPQLMNTLGGRNKLAWEGLTAFKKPFLTIWGNADPGQQGTVAAQHRLIDRIPGAKGQSHSRLKQASHFLQDDQGKEVARQVVEFMKSNPIPVK